jgi:NADH:ubiquinone oxidoreductase subunit 3 (subunit A)
MNKFIEILTFLLVGIAVLVAADQISGALERARARKQKEKADAAAKAASANA